MSPGSGGRGAMSRPAVWCQSESRKATGRNLHGARLRLLVPVVGRHLAVARAPRALVLLVARAGRRRGVLGHIRLRLPGTLARLLVLFLHRPPELVELLVVCHDARLPMFRWTYA